MFIAIRSDRIGDDPGLASVATAIAAPCLRNSSIGGLRVSRR